MSGWWARLRSIFGAERDPLAEKLDRTDEEVKRNLQAHAEYQAEINQALAGLLKASRKDHDA